MGRNEVRHKTHAKLNVPGRSCDDTKEKLRWKPKSALYFVFIINLAFEVRPNEQEITPDRPPDVVLPPRASWRQQHHWRHSDGGSWRLECARRSLDLRKNGIRRRLPHRQSPPHAPLTPAVAKRDWLDRRLVCLQTTKTITKHVLTLNHVGGLPLLPPRLPARLPPRDRRTGLIPRRLTLDPRETRVPDPGRRPRFARGLSSWLKASKNRRKNIFTLV